VAAKRGGNQPCPLRFSSAGRAEGTVALDAALVADGGAQLRPCPGEAPAASVRPPPDERVQHSSQLGKVAKGSLKEATSLSPLKAWPDPPAARSFSPSFPGSHPQFFQYRQSGIYASALLRPCFEAGPNMLRLLSLLSATGHLALLQIFAGRLNQRGCPPFCSC